MIMGKTERESLAKEGFVFVQYGDWDKAQFHLTFGDPVCILVPRGAIPEKAPIRMGWSNGRGAIVRSTGHDLPDGELFGILAGGDLI